MSSDIRSCATLWKDLASHFLIEIRSYLYYRNIETCDRYEKDKFGIYMRVRGALSVLREIAPCLTAWTDANTRLSPEVFINAIADLTTGLDYLRTQDGPDLARLDRAYFASVGAAEMILARVPEIPEGNPSKTKKTPGKKRSPDDPALTNLAKAWHGKMRDLTYEEFIQERCPGICGDQIKRKAEELRAHVNRVARRERYPAEKKRAASRGN